MKKQWSYIPLLLTAAVILVTAAVYHTRNAPRPALVPETCFTEYQEQEGLLDIHTAEEAQLMTLPGIGPTLARRILEYRAAHGPFGSVAELLLIDGLGQGKLEAILDLITVGG